MITVKTLSKTYRVHEKQEGLGASIRSLFVRKYRDIEAVKNISFEIRQGEMVGFIGPNGAGKTTTLKMLSGLLYPSSGEAKVLGYIPHERRDSYLKQISLIMGQKNQLWWDLPTVETFSLNKEIYEVDDKEYKKTLGELTELLDIKDVLNQPVRNLSLGQRMKCELIAALIHSPKVLFLDEPTIGLDIVMQRNVREFIKEYNKKHNATVILTSHYMDDVKEICKRIIMIDHGKIIFDNNLSSLITEYANYKTLVVVFNSKVKKDDLIQFGDIKKFEYPEVIINVPQNKVSKVAYDLLDKYDIDDIDINEPELEDMIRIIFGRHKPLS